MDVVSLLIALLVALLAGVYIVDPIVRPGRVATTSADHRLSSLQAERDRALTALEELEMDLAMQKINDDEYRLRRGELLTKGAQVLRELDELQTAAVRPAAAEDLETQLEAEVARLRSTERDRSLMACPRCGEEVREGDDFCAHCGEALRAEGKES